MLTLDKEHVHCPTAGPASASPTAETAEKTLRCAEGTRPSPESVPSELGTRISASDILPECGLENLPLLQLQGGRKSPSWPSPSQAAPGFPR